MREAEIDSAIQAFAAAGAAHGLYYISTPITTGLREFQLMDDLGVASRDELREEFADRWRAEVFDANEAAAIEYATIFGETVGIGHLVVNPASFHRAAWSQDDYDQLWGRLISDFPATVSPVPGWAYSRGARVEIALALRLGRQIVAADGSPRSVREVLEDCIEADEKIAANNWDRYGRSLPRIDGAAAGELHPADSEALAVTVFAWLSRERGYQVTKFGTDLDDKHTETDGLTDDGWWSRQLRMYYHRARVLGLDNPAGRQALAKYVATGCGLLESTIRTHGWLPAPGVSSGNLSHPNETI